MVRSDATTIMWRLMSYEFGIPGGIKSENGKYEAYTGVVLLVKTSCWRAG